MIQQFIVFLQDFLLWLSVSFHNLRNPGSASSSSSGGGGGSSSNKAGSFVRKLSNVSGRDEVNHHGQTAPATPSGSGNSANFLSLRHRQRRQESLFDVMRPLPLPLRRKTLVLDLDETLIHSTTRGTPDFHVKIEVTIDRNSCPFYVSKRPHCDHFLNMVSKWYELVIFTASMPEYAEPVIDWLDPKRLISRRYFRDSCIHREGVFLKNLKIIEPDLSRVLIIDNSPSVYTIVPDNAVPIEGWFNDRSDEALLDLIPFLDSLRFTDDVRSLLSLRNISNNWNPVPY